MAIRSLIAASASAPITKSPPAFPPPTFWDATEVYY
jgi:hypothetical protein